MNAFPELHTKASDTILVLKWLQCYLCYPWQRTPVLDIMLNATVAINEFYSYLYRLANRDGMDGPFLYPHESGRASALLGIFLDAYSQLSTWAHAQGILVYNVKPKLHYLAHIRLELHEASQSCHPTMNVILWATPADEDFIGKIARTSRKTHAVTTPLSTLRRYLIAARRAWRALQRV